MKVASLLLSSAVLLTPPHAGDLDLGFGNGGKIGFSSDYGLLALQPDGKVLQAEVDRSYHREIDQTIYSIEVSRHSPDPNPAIKDFHIDYSFGGSEGVGWATTRAVVSSSLAIIVLNFFISGAAFLIFPG